MGAATRLRPAAFCISALLVAAFVSFPAFAQGDPPKIEKAKGSPGELKLPDGLMEKDKKGVPTAKLQTTTCAGCEDKLKALRSALEAWYAAQAAESADKFNKSGGNDTAAEAQNKKAMAGLTTVLGEKSKDASDAIGKYKAQKKKPESVPSTAKLLEAVNDALKDLRDCESKCNEKTGGGGTGGGVTGGGDKGKNQVPRTGMKHPDPTKIKLPTVPPGLCWKKGEKEKYEKDAGDASVAIGQQSKLARTIGEALKPDVGQTLSDGAKQEADEIDGVLKKLADLSAQIDKLNKEADLKKDASDPACKEGSMLIGPRPPFRQPSGSFAVSLATDGPTWCTYTRATATLMTLTPADDDGNPIMPSVPVSDVTPGADKPTDGTPPVLADKLATDEPGVVIKDDPNWTWDPKEKVYVSKKDPKVKRPVPTTVKPGQMWDPEGDPDGTSPIEPETSGNSRTYIDPKTGKIITKRFVDDQDHVYERDDNFDQAGKPQLVRVYDKVTGKLMRRETTDPKTGTLTQELFDKEGKLTTVNTYKDGKLTTSETYENDKLIKRTDYQATPKTATDTPPSANPPADTPKTPTATPTPTPPLKHATDAPPTDLPTSIPNTVIVKAKESVLEGGPTGQPIQGQMMKLLPPEKPGLPGDGPTKTAQDTGFDKPPAQCTTGADGGCKIDVIKEDRPYYRLPTIPDGPKENYRVDVDVPKTTGGVVETTGKPTSPDTVSDIPKGADVVSNTIKIGNRTFVSLAADAAAGVAFSLREKYDRPGSNYEDDYCRDKQPGPPLGMQPNSFSALNADLPGVSVPLDKTIRAKRVAR